MNWKLSKCRSFRDFELTNQIYVMKIKRHDLFVWKIRLFKGKDRLLEKKFRFGVLAIIYVKRLMLDVENIVNKEKEKKMEREIISEKYIKLALNLDDS